MSNAPPAAGRLVSLDVFRGLTIAAMILVNNPGDSSTTYPQLLHAEWHGWTFTDLVFPFFLWIVGVAMTFSFAKRVERGENRGKLLLHIVRRSALIFGLGLLLNGFPYYNLSTLRIPGVLQRIAICYLIAAVIFLYTGLRGRIAWLTGFLLAYTVMMHPGGYEKDSNFAGYVDGLFLSGHMWSRTKTWDPEGIISTLPSISTVLFGVLTGMLLRSRAAAAEKTAWMFFSGNMLVWLGLIAGCWQPINKMIWTPSYVFFTAGMALVVFGSCYWLVDVSGWRWWSKPFVIYGMNAITVYVLSGLLARSLMLWKAGGSIMRQIIYERAFVPLASPVNASLLWALANVAVIYAAAWIMYRRGWFVKL